MAEKLEYVNDSNVITGSLLQLMEMFNKHPNDFKIAFTLSRDTVPSYYECDYFDLSKNNYRKYVLVHKTLKLQHLLFDNRKYKYLNKSKCSMLSIYDFDNSDNLVKLSSLDDVISFIQQDNNCPGIFVRNYLSKNVFVPVQKYLFPRLFKLKGSKENDKLFDVNAFGVKDVYKFDENNLDKCTITFGEMCNDSYINGMCI